MYYHWTTDVQIQKVYRFWSWFDSSSTSMPKDSLILIKISKYDIKPGELACPYRCFKSININSVLMMARPDLVFLVI